MSTARRECNKLFSVILLLLIVGFIGGLPASVATNHFQLLLVCLPLVVVGLLWLCAQLPEFMSKSGQSIKTTLRDILRDRSSFRARKLLLNSLPVGQRSS